MAISQFPSSSEPTPTQTELVNTTQATWSIPAGANLLLVSLQGGAGNTANQTGTSPPVYNTGTAGGATSVTAGNVTYSANGGAGGAWAGNNTRVTNSPLNGYTREVFINPAGLSTLNIQIGSGGGSGAAVTTYV